MLTREQFNEAFELDPNDHTQGIGYFQNKFECRIEPSREYKQYVRQVPQYHHDIRSMESYHIQTEVVPMQSIHLSSDSLNKLIAEQELIRHMRNDAKLGKRLLQQQLEDAKVRARNVSAQKAWDNYQLLLRLCK